MVAVGVAPRVMRTLSYITLSASALDVVQPDRSCTGIVHVVQHVTQVTTTGTDKGKGLDTCYSATYTVTRVRLVTSSALQ